MSFIELGCYVLSIVMMFSWSQVNTGHIEGHLPQAWYEMAIIFMMVVASALTLSGRTSLAFDVSERPLLKRLSTFLATSSLVLYLSNYYQIYYVSKMMKQLSLEEKTMYIIVFVTVSFAIAYIGGKLLLRLGRRLRSMIVEDAVCSG
jgi:Na+-transporting methylmalonyl-CoA/oxaloacetate decarboxylase beta subunit